MAKKLSTDQIKAKEYRKNVIIPNEIQRLQKILDSFGINLHIRTLTIHSVKNSANRYIKVMFKERYLAEQRVSNNVIKNKFAYKYVYCSLSTVTTKLPDTNRSVPFIYVSPSTTVIYNADDRTYKYYDASSDQELLLVGEILKNEYFCWILMVDASLQNFKNYNIKHNLLDTDFYNILDKEFIKFWYLCVKNKNLPEFCYPPYMHINNFKKQIESKIIEIPDDIDINDFNIKFNNIYDYANWTNMQLTYNIFSLW